MTEPTQDLERILTVIQVYMMIPKESQKLDVSVADANIAFGGVPSLFYVAHIWTEKECEDWDRLPNSIRLWMVSARTGALEDHFPILPFSVATAAESPGLVGFDGNDISAVSMHLGDTTPLYVGPTQEIRAKCRSRWEDRGGRATGKVVYWGPKIRLAAYKVQGGLGEAVKALHTLFKSGPPECVVFFAELRRQLARAGDQAKASGQPYGQVRPGFEYKQGEWNR